MTDRPSRTARLVAFACDRSKVVATAALLVAFAASFYVVHHFAITTNTSDLISTKLPYRQREAIIDRIFPPNSGDIVVVVDGVTPEIAEQGAADLAAKLSVRPDLFRKVDRPDAGPFFSQNGLLFADTAKVKSSMDQLIAAQPFLGPLASDPSLRGLMTSLSTALTGVKTGQAKLDQLDRPIHSLADALDAQQQGKQGFFSWQAMIADGKPDPRQLRHVILVSPKLNFSALEPGAEPSAVIRQTARDLGLDTAHGARVRLTGAVPLQDEEFASLSQGIGFIIASAIGAILVMLWFAVRSPRIIASIALTTFAGLVIAAAFGLLAFHRFNVISVAFIPLFVGLGIDFGIQFSVRYRSEFATGKSAREALICSGRGMGRSLTLAATAIASGFLSFAPTQYVGVSQLGLIAGVGMFIALGLNLTLLPALLSISRPPAPLKSVTDERVRQLDGYLLAHRRLVVMVGIGAALVSLALTPLLHFDFNPLHLRNPKSESVSTLTDLTKDPDQTPNTIDLLASSPGELQAVAQKVSALPEVSSVRTLNSFVPTDQTEKLALITDASTLLDLTLNPLAVQPAPSDAEVVTALTKTAGDLRVNAATAKGGVADNARRLAVDLDALAKGPPAGRARAAQLLLPGLNTMLNQARNSLQAQPVTLDSLPPELVRQWVAPDGHARGLVIPKGDANNDAVLRKFTAAVQKIYPTASGAAVSIQMSGHTIVTAFIEAGILSFIVITLLLLYVLRRVRDVAITMAPILLTGLLTLGSCVVIGQQINFANIIALPLLFGIGVAFHIYFVLAWRAGGSHLLQSSLTRGVFFSALTTATGFGSLWMSSHPGTASMGKLLMISLIWTLVSALLFQPALMGDPPLDAVSGPEEDVPE